MAPGARSKFGAPMMEPEVFGKQMYCIEDSIRDTAGSFRRPGNCAPRYAPGQTPVFRKLRCDDRTDQLISAVFMSKGLGTNELSLSGSSPSRR